MQLDPELALDALDGHVAEIAGPTEDVVPRQEPLVEPETQREVLEIAGRRHHHTGRRPVDYERDGRLLGHHADASRPTLRRPTPAWRWQRARDHVVRPTASAPVSATRRAGETCTAVTLYSGQLVAQSENSVVTMFARVTGWWKVV